MIQVTDNYNITRVQPATNMFIVYLFLNVHLIYKNVPCYMFRLISRSVFLGVTRQSCRVTPNVSNKVFLNFLTSYFYFSHFHSF